MKRTKRMKGNHGFTLAETLMAVLILLLVSAVVAAGIPAAASALKKAVDASHAQVLLSTTMTALRDELATAKDVKVEGTTISYTDSRGLRSEIKLGTEGQNKDKILLIKAKSFVAEGTALGTGNSVSRLLVSDQAATDMIVSYSSVTRDGLVLTFTGLTVVKDGLTPAKLNSEYKIRVVSAKGE